MNNIWLKIKVWSKIILFSLLLIYILVFIAFNASRSVKFWWMINHDTDASVLWLVVCAFFSGVICTLLARTVWRTWSQVREIQRRKRANQIERDLHDMKTKAAMLQTKPTLTPPD